MTIFKDDNEEAVRVLEQPWQSEKLLEVRTGKLRSVFGVNLKSAIFKDVRFGPVIVNKLGCEGDEHGYEPHYGPETAILQYSAAHYDRFKEELPQSSHLFTPGGFGENLVAKQANERNICIGDIIQIGPVVVQVTQPRAPCFKLNKRFQVNDMAARSQELFRTGWLYRVLKEGVIQAGDEMKLLERPYPKWTIAEIQKYLYHDRQNEEVIKKILEIKELGHDTRTTFENRLNKQYKIRESQLGGDTNINVWTDYRLVKKSKETPRILSLTFKIVTPLKNPKEVQPGSHIPVKLAGKLLRAYSVVSGDSNQFELAIDLSESSRGGSRFVHRTLQVGDTLSFGKITASFPLHVQADKHVFIAGGIGITAFITAAEYCQRAGYSFHLHYLVRNSRDIALKRYINRFGPNLTIYDKSAGNKFNAAFILEKVNDNTHIYCCGFNRLQNAIIDTAKSLGISSNNLHFEKFEVVTTGDPFVAELANSGKTIEVDGGKSLLDAIREAGLEVASSCEAGACGTCRVGVKRGRIEHRGTALVLEVEKDSVMLSCVSRGIGTIVLEL